MLMKSSYAVTIQLADNVAEFLHTAYNFLGFYKTQRRFFFCVNCLFFVLIISRARVTMHFQISFSFVMHTSLSHVSFYLMQISTPLKFGQMRRKEAEHRKHDGHTITG